MITHQCRTHILRTKEGTKTLSQLLSHICQIWVAENNYLKLKKHFVTNTQKDISP